MINHISNHPDLMIRQGICPLCKNRTLKDISCQTEFSHVSDHVSECRTHVFNRVYLGLQCRVCKWTNRTFNVL
jgi:hypothetical protein